MRGERALGAARGPSGWLERTWPSLSFGLLVLLPWIKALDPQVQLYYRDTARVLYPYKQFIAERLRALELPLWYPWNGGGSSLVGELVSGVFHPTNLLYLLLPFDLAFKLQHLSVQLLAGLGAFLLSRRLRCGRAAALVAAIGYGLSGYVASQASSNLTYALGAAAVPLAVHGLLRLLEAPGPGRLLWASFALSSCVLAGEPQSALFAATLGATWAFAEAAGPPGDPRPRWLRAPALVAAWCFAALLLSSPALLPGLSQVARSSRAEGVSRMDAVAFANRPVRLLGLLLPGPFDDTQELSNPGQGATPFQEYFATAASDTAFSDSIALGAPLLLLAAVGAARRRSARALAWAGAALIVLSTADAFGLQSLLIRAVPALRFFRSAEKYLGPASLLLALAGAAGASAALEREEGPAGARALLGACCAAAGLLAASWLWLRIGPSPLLGFLRAHGRTHQEAPALAFAAALRSALASQALLCAALAGAAALRLRRPLAPADGGAAAVCACAALFATSALPFVAPLELLHGPFPLAEALRARAGPSEGRYRIWSDSTAALVHRSLNGRLGRTFWTAQALHPEMNALARVENAASYTALEDRDVALAAARAPAVLQSLFAVRFQIRDPWELAPAQAAAAGFAPGPFHLWVRELPESSRAFLVGSVAVAANAPAAAALLAAPGFDPRRRAVLVAAPGVALGAGDAAGRVDRVDRPSPEELRVQVDLSAPALLVVSEHFDPGWRARIDGRPESPVEVDLAALGVALPAGRHEVSLRFRPRGLSLGAALAFATLLALGGAAAARRRAQMRWRASTALVPPKPNELETAAVMRTSRASLGT